MVWRNQTLNLDFILLGIFDYRPTHIFLFSLVLGIFTVAFMGNTLMVLLIYLDTQLHTPMYLLLSQLSLMDLMLISTTVPKMAFSYLSGRKSISLAGCGIQIFFYVSLLGAECFLLAVMAYDSYVAVCHPLRYTILMNQKRCVFMTVASWILGSLDGIIVLVAALSFPYCSSLEIHHFFCDVAALLPLSCTDTSAFENFAFYLLCGDAGLTSLCDYWFLFTSSSSCHQHGFQGKSPQGLHHLLLTPVCGWTLLWSCHVYVHETSF